MGNNINKIESCYNNGEIKGGTRVGGIVSSALETGIVLIINRSYNLGNLSGFSETKYTSGVEVGGVFCQAWNGAKVYILNSYNTGLLDAKVENSSIGGSAAGIAEQSGNNGNPSLVAVLNSYNSGNITAKNFAVGISGVIYQSNLAINNVFNIGKLTDGSIERYSILWNTGSGSLDVKNAYYLGQEGVSPSNISKTDGMYEIKDDIKNNLVNILNENKNKINLSEYGEEIKDYELVNWIQGIDGYPTLKGVGDY